MRSTAIHSWELTFSRIQHTHNCISKAKGQYLVVFPCRSFLLLTSASPGISCAPDHSPIYIIMSWCVCQEFRLRETTRWILWTLSEIESTNALVPKWKGVLMSEEWHTNHSTKLPNDSQWIVFLHWYGHKVWFRWEKHGIPRIHCRIMDELCLMSGSHHKVSKGFIIWLNKTEP